MFRFTLYMRSCLLVFCLLFCTVYFTVGQRTSGVSTAQSATKSNADSLPKTEPQEETVLVEPEDTATSEPTGEAEEPATPEPTNSVGEPEQWPEPGPNWVTAVGEWGQAWPLHIYLFAVCYTIIALTGVCQVIQLYGTLKITTLSLNVLLVVFGLLRAVSLFTDPYMSTGVIPFPASRVMWSMSLPCLTSAFSFLLLVLLDTTKMTMGPPRFQKFSSIVSVTIVDFALVFITDTSVFLFPEARPLLVVCQTLFIIWGLLLAVGYTVAANKISKNIQASSQSAHSKDDQQSRLILRLTRLMYVSAFVGFTICCTHAYAAAGVFGAYSDINFVDAWPWWAFKTLMRTEEVAMCVLIFAMAKKSNNGKKSSIPWGISRCIYTVFRRPNRKVADMSEITTNAMPTATFSQNTT